MADNTFRDPLVGIDTAGLPERFFDRFMFNMHPTDTTAPAVITGFGVYPARGGADGYVIATVGREQRNLRFTATAERVRTDGAGPLRFDVLEPHRQWRLRMAPNDISVEFDVTWCARTAPWIDGVTVANRAGDATAFEHLFQSGRYTGWLRIDGIEHRVDGWYGQRDRSRGVRNMAGGQGLHLWLQAQFPAFCVGLLLVESRSHERLLITGAVMHENGNLDAVREVRHDLTFDTGLDLSAAELEIETVSGEMLRLHADGSAGGGYMAGGGYGRSHRVPVHSEHVESDRYPLDGTVTPRSLVTALTDRVCVFSTPELTGTGILEFAVTRSPDYRYRPTIADR